MIKAHTFHAFKPLTHIVVPTHVVITVTIVTVGLLREYCKLSELKNPDAITGTKLRKHLATLSTVLNLRETEMGQLADFMGHSIRVHSKFYRLPESTLQLARVSKVLMAMEQGRLGDFQGKNLDEIHIDPNGWCFMHFHFSC